jgi:DNA-binding CsgD family transcriptional regulator
VSHRNAVSLVSAHAAGIASAEAMPDRARVASAMSLIIGAKSETELWQRYAVGSRMFVPVPFYGFDLFDTATGSLVHGGGWGVSDDFLVRWAQYGQRDDVVFTEMLRCGRAVALSDVMEPHAWRRSRAYLELYRLHDITALMHVPLIVNGRPLGSLSFGTSSADGLGTADRIAAEGLALLVSTVLGTVRGAQERPAAQAAFAPGAGELSAGSDGGLLTEREIAVARLAADGMRDREIADALCVTVHTVKQHLKNSYRKSGVRSRVELARILPPGGEPAGQRSAC